MSMQLTIPSDMEALVEKRLASGAFTNVEDVLRRALEALDAEETWTEEERRLLDLKIGRALEQAASGRLHGPEAASQRLATLREVHLSNRGR